MSTTFDTAASTLDASINRLEYIKVEARIYHKNQIAEARRLSVEAIRLINDAKLANDRAEEMKKTIAMFQLERRGKQTVQKEKIQARSLLIAPTVEEESHAFAAEVQKEVIRQSLVTEPTVKEQPKGTVNEEELAKKKTIAMFQLEKRVKDKVQKKERIQSRSLLIAQTVEEESNALAAEVQKEVIPQSLVTEPTIIKEQPKGTVIEKELTKEHPVKNEPVKEDTALIAPTKEEEFHAAAAEVRKEDPPTSLVTAPTIIKEQPNEKSNGTVIEEELAKDNPVKNEPLKKDTALHEVTKNKTIEEQSTQEERIMVDTAVEEEVTTEETIEEESQTEEEITTVDTLVEEIEEFTKDDQPHQLADLIVLLKQYQKKESQEDSMEKEASSSKKERATTHEKAVTTKSSSEEAAATKEDIAIETVIETGRVVKVMETWRVATQQGIVALGKPEGGGVDNNRSHAVRPATVFPSLLSCTAESDNVVVHEHCWCERV